MANEKLTIGVPLLKLDFSQFDTSSNRTHTSELFPPNHQPVANLSSFAVIRVVFRVKKIRKL